jgi:hypothetical protein
MERIGGRFMDPIYGVSRVDRPLSPDEQSPPNLRITSDAQRSLDALKLEAAAQHRETIEKWKYILHERVSPVTHESEANSVRKATLVCDSRTVCRLI